MTGTNSLKFFNLSVYERIDISPNTIPKKISTMIWVRLKTYIQWKMLKRLLTCEKILAIPEQRVNTVKKDDKGNFANHMRISIYLIFIEK